MSHFPHTISKDWLLIGLTILSMLAAGFERYTNAAISQESRLSTVEAHEQSTAQRLDRMEDKLDTIFYYVTGVRPSREDKTSCQTCPTVSTPH